MAFSLPVPKLPKVKPPAQSWSAADVQASLAANPYAGLGNYTGSFPSQDAFPATPTGASSASGPGSTIRVPGFTPDYAALLAGDPNVIAGKADYDFFTGQVNDQRRAAIRSAIIQGGLVPPGTFGDVDEATLAAARANPYSSAAELARQRDRSQADLGALLGARGMTRSGALAGGSSRIQEGYERGTYQLTNSLLSLISGAESAAADKLYQARLNYNQLKEQAAQRIANDPRYQPIGEGDAVLDPDSGLYVTPDGRWYNRDGTRASAPAPRTTVTDAPAPSPSVVATPITEYPDSRPATNVGGGYGYV